MLVILSDALLNNYEIAATRKISTNCVNSRGHKLLANLYFLGFSENFEFFVLKIGLIDLPKYEHFKQFFLDK